MKNMAIRLGGKLCCVPTILCPKFLLNISINIKKNRCAQTTLIYLYHYIKIPFFLFKNASGFTTQQKIESL